jgi:hypothetical protein
MSDVIERAEAVARGLIASGTAKAVQRIDGGYRKIMAGNAIHYWVRDDGHRGFRVHDDGAEVVELTAAFLDEMAAAGQTEAGIAADLEPRFPSPSEDPSLYDAFDYRWLPPDFKKPVRSAIHR